MSSSATILPVPVGALACQMNSHAKELQTVVLSCAKVTAAPETASTPVSAKKANGKSAKESTDSSAATVATADQYDVVFQDSVLFPEGGGQPGDLGTINGTVPVIRVRRNGDTCVVTVPTPLEVGSTVSMQVDWPRRMDAMQHHTAQHLLSAVMEKELGIPTDSWAHSHPTCYIQVPTSKLTEADLRRVEEKCNSAIRSRTVVQRQIYESRAAVPSACTASIPADVNGPIRLIDVEGIDSCTCCGTHVENLSELQLVKLLHMETKGNTAKVHFVAGDRAIALLGEVHARERELVKELAAKPEDLLSAAKRRGRDGADAAKQAKGLLAEVATLSAASVTAQCAACSDQTFTYLREDADMQFLTTIGEAIQRVSPQKQCVLACGSVAEEGTGQFLVLGPDAKAFAEAVVCPGLEGKGGLSKAGYRGKCNLKRWKAFLKSLASTSSTTSATPNSEPAQN